MWTSSIGLRASLVAVALILAPTLVRADCSADFRRVEFDTSKSGEFGAPNGDRSSQIVPLRSYLCRAGTDPNSPQIRVEFHRLSDGAASALIEKRPSAGLTQIFGSPRIIENDVFKTYADLLRRFGAVTGGFVLPLLRIEAPRSEEARVHESPSDIKGIRTLINNLMSSDIHITLFYPAADEIEALRAGSVPASLRYFYRQSPA